MAMSRAGGWIVGSLLCIGVPTLWAAATILRADDGGPIVLDGARLGMTPAEVRRAFTENGQGQFQSEPTGSDVALVWTPGASSELDRARFEFHAGLLVAVRLRGRGTDAALLGDRFQETPGSVLTRRDAGGGVTEVTLIARDCPTHAAEVARLLASR